jgi:hypothetical protein
MSAGAIEPLRTRLGPTRALHSAPTRPAAKPYCRTDETVVKQTADIRQILSKPGCVKMIEATAAILSLFSAGIFLAHAVDAYLAQ